MKTVKYLFIVLFVVSTTNFAQSSNIGTSVANFLKIGVGARAVAMGEAYTAISDEATAAYWNPGGLGFMENQSANFSYTDWIFDTNLNFFSVVLPTEDLGTFAVSLNMFSSGDIEETTISKPTGTGRVVSASDLVVGVSYAKQLTDRFSAGASLKYIRENLALESASAVAVDIGSIFIISEDYNLRLGLMISNLGTDMKFEGVDLETSVSTENSRIVEAQLKTYSWAIPLTFKVGLASDIIKTEMHRLTLSLDVNDARDFEPRETIGFEYGFNSMFFLRGGYKFNYDEESYTAGTGINYDVEGVGGIKFDYAYSYLNRLGRIHRFSINFTL